MSDSEKKFYELSEKEHQAKLKEFNNKSKQLVKRVLLGVFCVVTILLMVLGLLAGIFYSKNDDEESSANNTPLVLIIDNENAA